MDQLIQELSACVGSNCIILDEEIKQRSHHIWQMDQPLKAKAVLLPRSTAEVSAIIKTCNQHRQPVVLHGGLTGLVGGTETLGSDIVISFERMNSIEEVDPISRTITVQAGAILEQVQEAAASCNLLFPLNFGAKGSAQIGGIIATNAGGLRVLRYGMTRHLVLGVEAVLADGTVVSSLKKLVKDNSGYDLKQLFIGSEGTLGLVTRAILRLVEEPKTRVSALAGLESYEQVTTFLKHMDQGLAGGLSSFEIMWPDTYKVLTGPLANVPPPLAPGGHNYYVLLDFLGHSKDTDQSHFQMLLEQALDKAIIEDVIPAVSPSEIDRLWSIRENVDPMVASCKHPQQFDISLPVPLIGEIANNIINDLYQIPEVEKVYTFGHMADGNIHFVVGKSNLTDSLREEINHRVYQPLQSIGGSVSAEHGIGFHKKQYLAISRSETEIELMKKLKKTLDPNNILNPGRIFDL